jgi:predicted HAD superfamily phosphohydrolase YqeG
LKNLEKKDIDLIVCDLDDTIFSTKELLERDYRK